MKMCIPGDVIAIVAGSGVGKTTLAMELGKQEARSKNSFSLIASLEMSQAGLFFRASTIESENHVDNYVPVSGVANDLMSSTDLKCKVIGEWKNLLIIDKGGLSLDRIVEYYKKAQEIYDGKISNLIIDYAQNIQGAEDITYAMVMARKFKEVAKELNTKLFVAMQTNKTYQTDYMEVNKIHIEGAGAYVQACDYIIAFWKSMDQDNRLHGKFLKDRWNGPNYQFDMVRDGLKYHSENYVPDKNNYGGL
jgi:replicative DNA helicase